MTAIPAGMVAWHGGDAAPEDWDGNEVAWSVGPLFLPARQDSWKHDATPGVPNIVAYTPRTAHPVSRQDIVDDAAHPEQRVDGWQPIETAPKMRGILLWADTSTSAFPNWRMGSGYYQTGMDCWIWEGEQVRSWAHPPTHWMPLPPAPGGHHD